MFGLVKDRVAKAIDWLAVAAAAIYIVIWAWHQTKGILGPTVLEFDARSQALPAFRFHGTGIFPNDLGVDHFAAEALPAWKAIYWIGTLFTDPFTVSKIVPFLLLAVVVWQGYALGKQLGRPVLGAALAVLFVHCLYLWNRMVGGNPRAFGYPLVIMFVRYATGKHEKRTLMTLVLMALCYPSALVVCAPSYGLLLLPKWREWKPWARFGGTLAACALIGLISLRPDPRIGRVTTPADAPVLPEMAVMMAQPTFAFSAKQAFEVPFGYQGPNVNRSTAFSAQVARLSVGHFDAVPVGLFLIFTIGALATRRIKQIPLLLPAMLLSSVAGFWLAYLMRFRLYFPDRMLIYTWPIVSLVALPLLAKATFDRLSPRFAPALAAFAIVVPMFILGGSAIHYTLNLYDWPDPRLPVVRFLAEQPSHLMVAARPVPAAQIQTWAQKRVLFSTQADKAHFYEYGLEMRRRMDAFYRAYYSYDLADLRRFRDEFGVDLLYVDVSDFTPAANNRRFNDMTFADIARNYTLREPRYREALAHPPDDAVVFRDGPVRVIDLHKL
jgi:hypothetical protein